MKVCYAMVWYGWHHEQVEVLKITDGNEEKKKQI